MKKIKKCSVCGKKIGYVSYARYVGDKKWFCSEKCRKSEDKRPPSGVYENGVRR